MELADTVVDLSGNAVEANVPYEIAEPLQEVGQSVLTMDNDLNDLTDTGVYTYSDGSIPANAPYYRGGTLLICDVPGTPASRQQLFVSDRGNRTARRTWSDDQWGRWEYPNAITDGFVGKTVSILGDSVSTYKGYVPEGEGYRYYYNGKKSGVSSVDQTWWKRLIDQTGMVLCVNNSVSASCCVSAVDNGTVSASSDERIEGLTAADGTTPDVILVFMGTNDYGHGVQRGKWNCDNIPEKPNERYFSDSYALMLSKIKALYPEARVYCCTLPYTSRSVTFRRTTDHNRLSVTRSEWNDVIRRIASYYECEIIEFEHCGINGDNLPFYSGDDAVDEDGVTGEGSYGRGLHPNARGHELLYLEALKHFMYEG